MSSRDTMHGHAPGYGEVPHHSNNDIYDQLVDVRTEQAYQRGRMESMETRQDRMDTALERLIDRLEKISQRMWYFIGATAVVSGLVGFLGWYMVQAGIPPLDGAIDRAAEQIEETAD
ncbi:MAG: hypothetical protein ACLFSR_03810 [Halomonas sp.]